MRFIAGSAYSAREVIGERWEVIGEAAGGSSAATSRADYQTAVNNKYPGEWQYQLFCVRVDFLLVNS